jgi:hypothetical protein
MNTYVYIYTVKRVSFKFKQNRKNLKIAFGLVSRLSLIGPRAGQHSTLSPRTGIAQNWAGIKKNALANMKNHNGSGRFFCNKLLCSFIILS